ncbi:MAG: DMT family transporter [Roseovarius sp.]|nr:DMT family transporter [Roseovarius sp.]
MRHHPLFGLGLACLGALVLTPDALFMRLSGMGGYQMVGWRGVMMGAVMLVLWALSSRTKARDLVALCSGMGLILILSQYFNMTLFSLGIAHAPVAVMLLGVATVPVFAALLSRLVMGERTRPATWAAIVAVLAGLALAVSGGKGPEDTGSALIGALAGLSVALVLALNFVVLRARPDMSIPLVIGVGAALAGATGWAVTGPVQMADGTVWAIAVCGLVILPVSFFSLSLASRHTHASNVSLLLLLETVLGPLWVWLGVGERPTPVMLAGGAVVVVSLALYLWHTGRRRVREEKTTT